MLLTPSCAVCSANGHVVCAACAARLRRPVGLPPPLGLDGWSALLRYDDAARRLLIGLKNRQRRDLVAWLADGLVAAVPRPGGGVLTWAPTGAARRRGRGFDQAELLALALARRWELPCASLLRRLPGPAQAGRTGADRRVNPRFRASGWTPEGVVLVDDVATTGATLAAAARALRASGATKVTAVVAARAGWGDED